MATDITVSGSDDISVTVSGGADTRANVADSGTLVVSDVTELDFDTNLSVTDDGDGSVTVDASGGGGGSVEVQNSGNSLTTGVTLLDFITGLTASEPATDEIDVNIDESVLKDGGAAEIDAAEFAAGLGSAGNFLQSDGLAATWANVAFGDLTGTASLAQLAEILDGNNDVEADHLAAANLPAHASRHSDGGADELDAADLAGALGSSGNFLQSDGLAATWANVAFGDLTGTASLAQLAEILDGSNDIEADHLSAGNLPAHASRHSDGGADELDVADLAGALGTSGQVPQSDGAAVTWVTLDLDDLSDVTNIASIDQDTLANRPAAGTADRVFIAEDVPAIYRDNGTSWDVLAVGDAAIKDGGNHEVDVVELAGGSGTADQVPITDGAAVSWSDIGLASLADTLDKNALDGSVATDGQVWTSTGSGAQWEAAAGGLTSVSTATVTASGGSTPAVDTTITNVTSTQTVQPIVTVSVDADPAFSADYAFNYDYTQIWDDTNSQVDIGLTVNWDTDPGGGNDVTLLVEVFSP